MKFIIDTEIFKKLDIPPDVGFYLASVYFGSTINNETFERTCRNGYLTYKGFERGFPLGSELTQAGVDAVESLFLHSEIQETVSSDEGTQVDRFEALAEKLRELFPAGRKEGTSLQWRDSVAIISKRLKTLVKKYNAKFTDEQAIEATRKYIESFNGNYSYMQTLRYFIFKNKVVDGAVEEHSQLLSFIENAGNEDQLRQDWISTMI